ncbi:MAG TPA: EAL domain-containing protein [Pseudomonadota bacterium]|nr:EAL domain-containing protein [Pseudomonadota bacterium]
MRQGRTTRTAATPRRLLALLGLALATAVGVAMPAGAAERAYYFERASTDDALAQNTVNAILQDRAGYIWIATQGGLHRHDGYGFVLFQRDPENPRSLPDNFVTALAQDAAGTLWVGTDGAGVARYDTVANQFIAIAPDAASQGPGKQAPVTALHFQAGRGLWVADGNGITLLDQDEARRTPVALDGAPGAAVVARRFAVDGGGTLWVAASNGLHRIAVGAVRAERVAESQVGPAHSVMVDSRDRVLVGTDAGLYRVDRGLRVERLWPAPDSAMPASIHDLVEAPDGRLWLAVFGNGIAILDPATGAVEHLHQDPRMAGSLPEETIRVLALDRSGQLWLGGDALGISHTDPAGARFRYVVDGDTSRRYTETNNIRSIHEDAAGDLWIGTEGDGLKRYERASGRFEYHGDALGAALPAEDQGRPLRVYALAAADPAQLWVATNLGAFLYEPATRHAELLPHGPGRADALPDRHVRAVVAGRDGSVWFGTSEGGLARHRPADGSWSHFPSIPGDANSLWHPTVMALREDRDGRLWIGTLDGLNLYDPASNRVRRIPRSGSERHSIAGNRVRAIHQSDDGTIWIGTQTGLSRLDELGAEDARFSRYLTRDGLPDSAVYGILEEPAGTLWLSTNRGVARLDRASGRFTHYTIESGLQGLEFNGGAALRLADGELAFGGAQGLNLFRPQRFADSAFQPRVVATAVQVGGERRLVADPLAFERLQLSMRDRVFGVEVASLDYAAPARNRFEHRLEGFDDAWVPLGTRREITYTNLDAGSYTLQVRGTNRDQAWSPEVLQLQVEVTPQWWASAPMKLLYGLLALALVAVPIAAHRRKVAREQQYTRELAEREERLRVAIWGSGDEFWDWEFDGDRMHRIGAEGLLGAGSEHVLTGEQWRQGAIHPDDLPRVEQILAEHVAGRREFFESQHRIRNAAGEWVWVLSRGKIVERDPSGQPVRMAGTARDITLNRAAERERRIAEEVIRSMSEAVTVTGLDFLFSSINPAFTRMTGYQEAEIVGRPSSMLNCEQHSDEFHSALRNTLERTGHWSGEIWQRRKDGEEFLCWLELSEVTDREGNRTHWVGVLTDITDRKRAEQELRYLANYDTLTGLPNRTLLGERLAHALIRARRHGSKVSVLFLDLDRFKHVNDSMGHAAGDRLLKAAAARIQANVRESDTVARLGGDEFTVIIEDITDQPQAERVAVKLIEAFIAPLDIDGRHEVVISPSIGISIYPDHGQVPTDLLKFADTAMYMAKDKGRNTFQTYTEAMDAQARLRASMVGHLHKAVERGELHLVYQPKMSLSDGRITGVEALLRWKNPDLGPISPVTFIPLAEETGLIVPIGEWVLREACVQLQRWIKAGLNSTTVAVNVSMLQLLRGELYTRLREIIEDFRIPAHRIELELTESMVMANAEQSISTLTQIKSLGVNVAIDDFGTGYSSLAYLKRLPIDTLKIDKEFVGDITTDPDDEAITATVITMAHSLGLDVIAEGVETPEQLDYLREQKCDEVQGNLISPPLDPERIFKLLLDRAAAFNERTRAASSTVREFPGAKRPER